MLTADAATPPADGGVSMRDSMAPIGDPVCGNGVQEADEACDDGNDDDTDGCRSDCSLTPTGGPLVPEMPGAWETFDIEGAVCRDGSPTGITLNYQPDADGLLIYLAGGGACWNAQCALTSTESPRVPASTGIFDRSRDDNPFRDWSHAFVQYCTGDVHLGDHPDAAVEGLSGTHQFVGYRNLGLYLERLVPTFPEVSRVVLSGSSAGGFGAGGNAQRVQEAFGAIPVVVLNDSGPPMPTDAVSPCLQRQWRETWNLDATVLKDCGENCPNADEFLFDLARHQMSFSEDTAGGFFSFTADRTIRAFFGFGQNECVLRGIPDTPPELFEAGLNAYRAQAMEVGRYGTYFVDGGAHTCLTGTCFYETEAGGVPLTQWIEGLFEGRFEHVGP